MPKKVGYPGQPWGQSGKPHRRVVEQQNREVAAEHQKQGIELGGKTRGGSGNVNTRKMLREVERAERERRY